MASSAEIIPTTPETLPSDFSGWDSEDPPAALPAGSGDFKPVPGSSALPEPPAQRASARLTAAPAIERPSNPPSLTPAAAFAEAEDFLNTFRPKYFDPEDLRPKSRRRTLSMKNKTLLAAWSSASIVLLAVLIGFVYPRLTGRTAMAKQSAVRQPAPIAQTMPSTAAISKTARVAATRAIARNSQCPGSGAAAGDGCRRRAPAASAVGGDEQATDRTPRGFRKTWVPVHQGYATPAGFGVGGMETLNGSGSGRRQRI